MRGRLVDAWKYTWRELWEPLEQFEQVVQLPDGSEETVYPFSKDIHTSLFAELEKALKDRLKTAPVDDEEAHRIYFETSTDPDKARSYIKDLESDKLAGDADLVVFFKNAYDVLSENSDDLATEFVRLLSEFFQCHNLRYKLQDRPFKLQPHLSGVFASLFAEIVEVTEKDEHLLVLMQDFEHAFYAMSRSHNEADIKTCIAKATILVEGIGSVHPDSRGSTLGDICGSIQCWPHLALRDAVKKIYGFCSDYPAIRHAGTPQSKLRSLELRDSIIVSLLLLTSAGYFLTYQNIADLIGMNPENT